jgi:hypothetical protein
VEKGTGEEGTGGEVVINDNVPDDRNNTKHYSKR